MKKEMKRKLPEDLAKLILETASKNFDKNSSKFKDIDVRRAYLLAYLHGYEAAWSIYTDSEEDDFGE